MNTQFERLATQVGASAGALRSALQVVLDPRKEETASFVLVPLMRRIFRRSGSPAASPTNHHMKAYVGDKGRVAGLYPQVEVCAHDPIEVSVDAPSLVK